MKTVYIPKGETVSYESLVTDRLVIKGCVHVLGDVRAKTISGNGVLHAGSVQADVIRLDELESAGVICKRLLAKRVQTPEVIASDCAVVSCFLSAAYVETGKLTVLWRIFLWRKRLCPISVRAWAFPMPAATACRCRMLSAPQRGISGSESRSLPWARAISTLLTAGTISERPGSSPENW